MQYCTECGKAMNMTDKFCSHCGTPSVNNDTSNQSDLGKPIKDEVDDTSSVKKEESESANQSTKTYIKDGITFKSNEDLENYKFASSRLNKKNNKKDKPNNLFRGVVVVLVIIIALYIFVQFKGCDLMNDENFGPLLRTFQFDNTICSCEGLRWFDPTFGYKLENLKPSYVPWTYYGDDCL